MALKVEHAGKYGPHGVAHRKGVRKGDIVTSFDSRSDLLSEQAVHAYVVTTKKHGQTVPLTYQREGRSRTVQIPIQQ